VGGVDTIMSRKRKPKLIIDEQDRCASKSPNHRVTW